MKKSITQVLRRAAAFLLAAVCLPCVPLECGAEEMGDEDLLEIEWQQNGSLLVPSSETAARIPEQDAAQPDSSSGIYLRRGSAPLPEAYSLLDDGGTCYVTSVKNQGNTGLCWAYAALGSCESNIMKQGLDIPDEWKDENDELNFSEGALGWYPYLNHAQAGDTASGDYMTLRGKGTGGGNCNFASSALAAGIGTQLEQYGSVADWDKGYSEYQRYVSYYRMYQSDILWETDETSVPVIKTWLMDTGAVSASFYSKADFCDNGTSNAYYQTEASSDFADHAILIVGWDDGYARENFAESCRPKEDGAWLVRNSWGDGDAYGGYFWLSYEEPSLCEVSRFLMRETEDQFTRYQYDGSVAYACARFLAGGNIFTAEEDGVLEEVMFPMVIFNPETAAYTISVYHLRDDSQSPADGELAGVCTGTVQYGGHKTVSLGEQAVSLQKGERFGVVLELRSTDTEDPLYMAMESKSSSGSEVPQRSCLIQPGQSYLLSTDYTTWIDVYDLRSSVSDGGEKRFQNLGNLSLKAIVRRTKETVCWTQLEKAMAYGEPDAQSGRLYREAYEAAALLPETASQRAVDNAAANLLAGLEREGILQYPQLVYAGTTGVLRGDVDQNGEVATRDAYQALLNCATEGAYSYSTLRWSQAAAGDVNEDGKIDTMDAYYILLYCAMHAAGYTAEWSELIGGG